MIFSRLRTQLAKKAWERAYHIPKHLEAISELYRDIDGFHLSKSARLEEPRLDLTYGEINLYSFLALMSLARPDSNTVFYDLGSGLAKTVLAFTACYQPRHAYGIEILASLHEQAQLKLNQTPYRDTIHLLHQDIRSSDWSAANLIFLNVASFVPDTWNDIQAKLLACPVETLVTCVKPLADHQNFNIYPTEVLTSWGIVPAFIHRHKNSLSRKLAFSSTSI